MSISSVTAAIYTPPVNSASSPQSQIGQAFQNLAQALQSNNVTGAKQAYTALSQLLASQGTSQSSPFSQALGQIGAALQANNLAGAQRAFATLLQHASALQPAAVGQPQTHGHHGHHHHGGTLAIGSAAQATSGTSLTAAVSGQGSVIATA
jgi:hypothetical protein